ncbi:MAG: pyruvate, water dikinase regulatory protein [Thermoanaerobacteraceae bacterium]|nr:pyruvate, water dikinase regulatory protein [Thermoanaerobacteraceae bacterium]
MANSRIYIVSDSSGESLRDLVETASLQLKRDFTIVKIPYVGDIQEIKDIVYQAKAEDSIIFSAIIISNLRDTLLYECATNGVKAVDLLQYVIELLKYDFKGSGQSPAIEEYSQKISAMEYVFLHDDGLKTEEILKADVVIIGVSRTSKTPLCMYLANKGIKAANIPLIPEVEPPKEIFMVPSDKIVGLTIAPDKLHHIRAERIKAMGLGINASYATMERIKKEINYAESIMDSLGCLKIDVTNKAVEEAAQIIMGHLKINNV